MAGGSTAVVAKDKKADKAEKKTDVWVILSISAKGATMLSEQTFSGLRAAKDFVNQQMESGSAPTGQIAFAKTNGIFTVKKKSSAVLEAV